MQTDPRIHTTTRAEQAFSLFRSANWTTAGRLSLLFLTVSRVTKPVQVGRTSL
jgi:hypothetical protein